MVALSQQMQAVVFTPQETPPTKSLYVIHKGIVLYGGRVLTSGKVWGEDCIINSPHLQRRWCARAMNYLEVYMILSLIHI